MEGVRDVITVTADHDRRRPFALSGASRNSDPTAFRGRSRRNRGGLPGVRGRSARSGRLRENLAALLVRPSPPPPRLRVVPFRDDVRRGLFATRAPCRPNPIGLSCVRLVDIKNNLLTISGVDILDGTPLLDIKPYVPQFDAFTPSRAGWLDGGCQERTRADRRFGLNEPPSRQ